jgi:hypothetical protein
MFMASLSVKQQAALFRDGLILFLVSSVASATVATYSTGYVSSLSSLVTRVEDFAVQQEREPLESIRVALGMPEENAPQGTPIEPDPFIESQVDFVSDIISSEVTNHNNVERLSNLIINECLRQNYDPLFVAAVIRAESMFRQHAVSGAGARGLMQIMPATGRHLSKEENLPWNGNDTLHDPETNLRLGIAYLRQLEQRFKGNRERALIAYNWGPTNMEESLRSKRRPPQESVTYARGIIAAHRRWKQTFLEFAQADPANPQIIG